MAPSLLLGFVGLAAVFFPELVYGSNHYFIGDMRFLNRSSDSATRNGIHGFEKYPEFGDMIWPGNKIPYEFDSAVSEDVKERVRQGMKDLMKAVPNCIKFTEKTSQDKHWTIIKDNPKDKSCYSDAGRQPLSEQPQEINMGMHCIPGSIVHELLHTFGFLHEQSRKDRDKFVTINFENIQEENRVQYAREDEELPDHSAYKTENYGIQYNYASILHYHDQGFSAEGKPTFTNLKNKEALGIDVTPGQREYISVGDLFLIARRGGCKEPPKKPYPVTGAKAGDIGEFEGRPFPAHSHCNRRTKRGVPK